MPRTGPKPSANTRTVGRYEILTGPSILQERAAAVPPVARTVPNAHDNPRSSGRPPSAGAVSGTSRAPRHAHSEISRVADPNETSSLGLGMQASTTGPPPYSDRDTLDTVGTPEWSSSLMPSSTASLAMVHPATSLRIFFVSLVAVLIACAAAWLLKNDVLDKSRNLLPSWVARSHRPSTANLFLRAKACTAGVPGLYEVCLLDDDVSLCLGKCDLLSERESQAWESLLDHVDGHLVHLKRAILLGNCSQIISHVRDIRSHFSETRTTALRQLQAKYHGPNSCMTSLARRAELKSKEADEVWRRNFQARDRMQADLESPATLEAKRWRDQKEYCMNNIAHASRSAQRGAGMVGTQLKLEAQTVELLSALEARLAEMTDCGDSGTLQRTAIDLVHTLLSYHDNTSEVLAYWQGM